VHLPSGGGDVTVLGADLIVAGTTVGPLLVTMTNAGTPALSGTIGYFASIAAGTLTVSAVIPAALTISDAVVEEGEWIGFDQTSGTIPAGAFISISYVTGKAGS
jgi:formyltetrahydrofolate synthetase